METLQQFGFSVGVETDSTGELVFQLSESLLSSTGGLHHLWRFYLYTRSSNNIPHLCSSLPGYLYCIGWFVDWLGYSTYLTLFGKVVVLANLASQITWCIPIITHEWDYDVTLGRCMWSTHYVHIHMHTHIAHSSKGIWPGHCGCSSLVSVCQKNIGTSVCQHNIMH